MDAWVDLRGRISHFGYYYVKKKKKQKREKNVRNDLDNWIDKAKTTHKHSDMVCARLFSGFLSVCQMNEKKRILYLKLEKKENEIIKKPETDFKQWKYVNTYWTNQMVIFCCCCCCSKWLLSNERENKKIGCLNVSVVLCALLLYWHTYLVRCSVPWRAAKKTSSSSNSDGGGNNAHTQRFKWFSCSFVSISFEFAAFLGLFFSIIVTAVIACVCIVLLYRYRHMWRSIDKQKKL